MQFCNSCLTVRKKLLLHNRPFAACHSHGVCWLVELHPLLSSMAVLYPVND